MKIEFRDLAAFTSIALALAGLSAWLEILAR